jgi:hypothetical protein
MFARVAFGLTYGASIACGFILVMLLTFVGCGPNQPHGYKVGNVEVFITDPMPPETIKHIFEAVELHTRTFESDFNFRLPPTKLFVQSRIIDACNGDSGSYAGCNGLGNGMINVWSEDDGACPALYHEYSHTLFGPGHLIWVWSFNDKRGAELTARLREKWAEEKTR